MSNPPNKDDESLLPTGNSTSAAADDADDRQAILARRNKLVMRTMATVAGAAGLTLAASCDTSPKVCLNIASTPDAGPISTAPTASSEQFPTPCLSPTVQTPPNIPSSPSASASTSASAKPKQSAAPKPTPPQPCLAPPQPCLKMPADQ